MAGLLQQIHQDEKITVLIIEHALNIVMSLSDKVIVLQNGEKIAEGTPQEISQDEKTIQAYIGRKKIVNPRSN
jgi:branched-chain amino acid transport system ATP-binding protein